MISVCAGKFRIFGDHPLSGSNNIKRSGFQNFTGDPPRDNKPHPPVNRPPVPVTPTQPASPSPEIESLTKSFQRLELNLGRMLQDKEKEIRLVCYTLQQQGRQHDQQVSPQLNYMLAASRLELNDPPSGNVPDIDICDSNDDGSAQPLMINLCSLDLPDIVLKMRRQQTQS